MGFILDHLQSVIQLTHCVFTQNFGLQNWSRLPWKLGMGQLRHTFYTFMRLLEIVWGCDRVAGWPTGWLTAFVSAYRASTRCASLGIATINNGRHWRTFAMNVTSRQCWIDFKSRREQATVFFRNNFQNLSKFRKMLRKIMKSSNFSNEWNFFYFYVLSKEEKNVFFMFMLQSSVKCKIWNFNIIWIRKKMLLHSWTLNT